MSELVELAAPGHAIRFQWGPAGGATAAEVAAAGVTIRSVVGTESLGQLLVAPLSGQPVVTVPAGKRIRSLTLASPKGPDGTELRSQADVTAKHLRLVVSIPQGSGWIPLYAVPAVPGRGVLPPSFTGATYANGVVGLPDVAAAQLRLSLVSDDDSFAPQTLSVASVTGVAAVPSRALELVDPAGTAIWSFPGELQAAAPAADVDLRAPAEAALKQALQASAAPDVTFRLRSSAGGHATIEVTPAHGALVRVYPGVVRTVLAGEPAALALPAAPPGETPVSATADLTIRYDGLRVLDAVADAVPAAGGAAGSVVGAEPVVRTLPPAALGGLAVARVGVIGRAPTACELSVSVGGAPGVVELEPSDALGVVWVDVPAPAPQEGPVAVSVRAGSGRFLWAGAPEGLLRLVVADPDPGGRPLRLGGEQLRAVAAAESHEPGAALPAARFAAGAPVLESPLFLTVDVSDLTLRYAR